MISTNRFPTIFNPSMATYDYIPKRLEISNMGVLHVQFEHVLQVQKLPDIHKDPFNRLLIAQAITEKLTIISADQFFKNYDVKLLS